MQNDLPITFYVLAPYTDRNVFPIAVRDGNAFRIIAEVNSCGGTPEQQKRNAVLLASAPKLLLALQDCLNVMAGVATGDLKTIRKDSPAIQRARDVIREAQC